MVKKIEINGVHINSLATLEREILNKLKINDSKNTIFHVLLENYMMKNKIKKIEIFWKNFSIPLLKFNAEIRKQKIDFKLGYESSMHFQAFNDILISEKEKNERRKKEDEIKENILDHFRKITDVEMFFEL